MHVPLRQRAPVLVFLFIRHAERHSGEPGKSDPPRRPVSLHRAPGISVFHLMFFVSLHSTGGVAVRIRRSGRDRATAARTGRVGALRRGGRKQGGCQQPGRRHETQGRSAFHGQRSSRRVVGIVQHPLQEPAAQGPGRVGFRVDLYVVPTLPQLLRLLLGNPEAAVERAVGRFRDVQVERLRNPASDRPAPPGPLVARCRWATVAGELMPSNVPLTISLGPSG